MLGTVPSLAHAVEASHRIAGWVPKEESIEQLLRMISGAMRGDYGSPTVQRPSSGCSSASTTNGIQA